MKILSRRDLDSIGASVFEKYKHLPQFYGKHLFRVDPELLCTTLLGLRLDYQHLSLDGTILGLTSFEEFGIEVYENDGSEALYFLDGKTVLIESNLKKEAAAKGRCNFTIVHEASHQILKMIYPQDYGTKSAEKTYFYKRDERQKHPIKNWEEWQANTLASAILLPEELIIQAMLCAGINGKIKLLNRVYAPEVYRQVAIMADFLGCSIKALAIRMKRLKLLEKEYLDDPYSFANEKVN